MTKEPTIQEGQVLIGPLSNEPINDLARFEWNQVNKVKHYWLEVNAMTKPMMVGEDSTPYGGEKSRLLSF